MKKYLFIFPKSLPESFFKIQLAPIVKYLTNHGNKCYVYFTSNKNVFKYTDDSRVTVNIELKVLLNQVDYVYLRNTHDFLKLFISMNWLFRKYKIIYDFRGFSSYEILYTQKNYFKFILLYLFECFIYYFSDKATTVSNIFLNKLRLSFGRKKEIVVIPCCISEVYHKKVKVESDSNYKFVYCGGIQKWQKFEEIINLYITIQKSLKSASLDIFTDDVYNAKRVLQKFEYMKIGVQYLPHKELMIKLKEYDFAFLLRDNVVMNNVASPVKFAEYLSCGLIPIISPGIGDYSQLVENENIGILTRDDFSFDINKLDSLINDSSLYGRIFFNAQKLTWDYNLKKVEFYNNQ